jgi:glycosyltransferase involved in cell wall biosynthesis
VKLIVLNYSMSSKSVVFAHQRDTVVALAKFFSTVYVFTSETETGELPSNVKVNKLSWKKESPMINALEIFRKIVPFLLKNQDAIVFSHMTDVHSSLLSPFTSILRMKHILWYAHAHNSIYLNWSSLYVSNIVSSTPGSCNLKLNRGKIKFINQGIKERDFPFDQEIFGKLNKIYYYGRLDRSKNIHIFNQLMLKLNELNTSFTLDIFGKPGSPKSESYLHEIKFSENLSSAIQFQGPIARILIPNIAQQFGIFINLFSGSLDKTLIENTFMGIPVVTWNREFCSEFGTWSGLPVSETLEFLLQEIAYIKSSPKGDIQREIRRRYDVALRNHSFDGWIERLVSVLKENG